MTTTEKILYKKTLLQKCVGIINERIEISLKAMENAQSSANLEDKSSAGDKYETSRAMNHLEKDMYAGQVETNRVELARLSNIDCSRIYNTPVAGSIVQCANIYFFIAAGLGKINFDGKEIYLLSPLAPLAKSLAGNKKGMLVKFNKNDFRITDIF
jgi:hypothetical protein